MAYPLMFSIGFCFLLFFHGCFAQLEQQQKQTWQNFQQLQQHRLRAKTQCSINRLNAQEPSIRLESEAGVTEFWDPNSEEFECAGVQAVRHVINRQGLLLPYYTNTPKLVYILQGSGILGTVIPGCAETYETELHSLQEEGSRGEEGGQGFRDRHQKLRRFRQGDVLALPAGITHWTYNDGQEPIISVAIIDNANEANQLDLNYRKFFLAGKPPTSQQSYGERERGTESGRGQRQREEEGSQQRSNIFNGFDEEILSEIFNVDTETIRNIQGQNDQRGNIVRAERLRLVVPEYEEEERQRERGRGRSANGLEETLCTMRLRENIRHPARSDIYNPRGGRISTINSQTLPVLNMLQLSAEHGVLYRNAMMAPHWVMNAHCVVYVTRGSARIQVVGNHGRSVFDDEVREGQILVVPQNFVVVKKASEQGFEYINFRTNDNFVTSLLAGRLSAIRSMPEEVLMNSYQISRDEVRNLKFNREEAHVFSPGSRSSKGQA